MKVQANLAAIADQVLVVDDRCWHLCITHATWELAVDIEMFMCSWIMVQDIILQGTIFTIRRASYSARRLNSTF